VGFEPYSDTEPPPLLQVEREEISFVCVPIFSRGGAGRKRFLDMEIETRRVSHCSAHAGKIITNIKIFLTVYLSSCSLWESHVVKLLLFNFLLFVNCFKP
jgi:hypothetical protein